MNTKPFSVVDMHCDTIKAVFDKEGTQLSKNNLDLSIEGMQKADYLLQFFAIFLALEEYDDPYKTLLQIIDFYDNQLASNLDTIAPVLQFSDIAKNQVGKKISALLTIEDSGILNYALPPHIEKASDILSITLERLNEVYNRGVRLMTISWNYPSKNSFPNPVMQGNIAAVNTSTGLTELGVELVSAMEHKGIVVDVSHLSDKGFYDVLEHTKKPFVASHSNARAVSGCARNLTDDMIKKLAERGGLTGINFCSTFLEPDVLCENPRGTIEHMVQHIVHIKNIGGIDCVGLGSDFDGIDGTQELNAAEKMPLLAQALDKAGFSVDEIEKIYSKNTIRMLKDVLK